MNQIKPHWGNQDEPCEHCSLIKRVGTTHYCGLGNRGAGGDSIPDTYWITEFPKYYPELFNRGVYPGGSGNYPVNKTEDLLEQILTILKAIEKELG